MSELALSCYFTWAQVDSMLRPCYTISPKLLRTFPIWRESKFDPGLTIGFFPSSS